MSKFVCEKALSYPLHYGINIKLCVLFEPRFFITENGCSGLGAKRRFSCHCHTALYHTRGTILVWRGNMTVFPIHMFWHLSVWFSGAYALNSCESGAKFWCWCLFGAWFLPFAYILLLLMCYLLKVYSYSGYLCNQSNLTCLFIYLFWLLI